MYLKSFAKTFGYTIAYVVWAIVAFIGAQIVASLVLRAMASIFPVIKLLNEAVLSTVFAGLAYMLAVLAVVLLPKLVKKHTTRKEMGVERLVLWKDIAMTALSIVPYIILTMMFAYIANAIWPQIFATQQPQEIPFHNMAQSFEYVVAFMTLVVLAPLAEELLFRGYLLGKLQTKMPAYVAVVVTALAFGGLHLPADHIQWTVGLDTFALGIVLGTLRVYTGSIWASVLLHGLKNAVAFYFLFINTSIAGII
ncbi:CPBP family intramembrane metalloprotease [Candidatus Saccharibacteria bacterium]|nr:CPBP family intramembrane metalloprotease [Candidatus Saccharibacteria bacterium]